VRYSRIVLALGLTLTIIGSKAQAKDYVFSITGIVTTESGAPLEGADVKLETDSPVYKGITAVQTVTVSSNNTGGFVFMYTSHSRGVKFSITVRKDGFEPKTVTGVSPPAAHEQIRLEKSAN
jgi:hypothetical protein